MLTGVSKAHIVRLAVALGLGIAGQLWGQIPTPREHFGYVPGDDYKLANYTDISGYFQKLAKASDRIRLADIGKTSEGRTMFVAFISAPDNLKKLDHYRDINRRLALGVADPSEARRLAEEGKAIVWIDSGLHASEVAPAQQAPDLAYRMLTDDSDEVQRIRRNVILIQVPVINPDGLDLITHWYRENIGTRYELAPMPWLYQKYAGHDNNRDWFMLNLPETRNVTRLLFQEWFPQIVYNQHQAPAFPARIFVPPYSEPLNPNIPAPVMEGINLIGSAIKERFARENKPGVLSYFGFDAWWNGGLRSVPAFHNMHGILTETALYGYGTPRVYDPKEIPERFANGIPTKEATVFYQRPWLGGKWTVRDAIDYMLTADFAILDLASTRSAQFLYKAWETARSNINAGRGGGPFAYIVPAEQWDAWSAKEMLARLAASGIDVRRSDVPFTVGAKSYTAGSYVMLAGQPFRGYLLDLLEPQKYPDLRGGATGPIKRPYDVAGWTLPMQMGVTVDRIESPFDLPPLAPADFAPDAVLNRTSATSLPAEDSSPAPMIDHRDNSSFLAIASLLDRNVRVRWDASGKILVENDPGFADARYELKRPRVAVYEPWTANADTGWTEWVLDRFQTPYTVVRNADLQKDDLRTRFDTIILAQQTAASILHGIREGERQRTRNSRSSDEDGPTQRPEFTGGIGITGLYRLEQFVRDGGMLIALDNASELPLQFFSIGARGLLRVMTTEGPDIEGGAPGSYYCPGSVLRITVDDTNPLAFGMPKQAFAFSSGGQAFEISLLPSFNQGDREVKTVARYAASNVLASGWISGERAVLGQPILVEARMGKGSVVMFGFRPQFRGQSFGTFKFLLNAVYLASAVKL